MVDLHCMAHKYGHLPEGLKELMTDISREVLRAQPDEIHGFIARYLGALLEARKALTVAGDVCDDIRASCCIIEERGVNEKEEGSVDERKINFKEENETNARVDSSVDAGKRTFTKENKFNATQDSSVGEGKRPSKEQNEENDKEDAVTETNESENTLDIGQPTQDESQQDKPGSSYVETEEFYRCRQHRDFWSNSVFSLPGSYMNLPTWKPYSVYDSIATASKPSSKRDHSGSSDYIIDRMWDDGDSST